MQILFSLNLNFYLDFNVNCLLIKVVLIMNDTHYLFDKNNYEKYYYIKKIIIVQKVYNINIFHNIKMIAVYLKITNSNFSENIKFVILLNVLMNCN